MNNQVQDNTGNACQARVGKEQIQWWDEKRKWVIKIPGKIYDIIYEIIGEHQNSLNHSSLSRSS
jgi:hypothetical protein